jgi:3-hydroxyisobutyrate dehydrogenase-like beta-hydroxyacid dehydrogenase
VTTVGIVSPGAMGSAVGAALVRGGARVVTSVDGRSPRTARLAERAGLETVPDLATVLDHADCVLSIVPPEAAESVAADVTEAALRVSARPLLADLNAVSPVSARRIEEAAAAGGIDMVDGSISGAPPWQPGTRIYLSGARAAEIAELPWDGVVGIVVGENVGAASAVKMSTASIYKGTTALLAHALLAAEANGVLEHVLADLRAGAPELVANVERRLATAATKAERYVGEMREIAATQEETGLTPALFEAIAEVYSELAGSGLAALDPEDVRPDAALADVLQGLRYERRTHVGE